MLKGKAKTDYQREYMRKLRLKGRLLDPSVRPITNAPWIDDIAEFVDSASECYTVIDADGNPIYEE